jgi:hypothetical protein
MTSTPLHEAKHSLEYVFPSSPHTGSKIFGQAHVFGRQTFGAVLHGPCQESNDSHNSFDAQSSNLQDRMATHLSSPRTLIHLYPSSQGWDLQVGALFLEQEHLIPSIPEETHLQGLGQHEGPQERAEHAASKVVR